MTQDLKPVDVECFIYLIRNRKVMLDADLAHLYGVTTSHLNKAVKRNRERFPSDFMFQLINQEFRDLIFQNGTSSLRGHGGRRQPPFAFTQEGVSMLSSVLRSDRAVQVNITIMRAFVRIREMLISHGDLSRKIAELEKKYDEQFEVVFEAIKELISNHSIPQKRIIGLGQPDK